MNILSLFDGISAGQLAANKAGIKVDKYYASEIDKNAIKVTMKNYPNTIQLGDVTKVKAEDLPKIDLLIGGSPCQGFSMAGKKLNFEDERSKLFFEYVRLLKECKPKYFLLENVKMKKEYQDIISSYLGVEPIEINSNLVSAQDRKRLYWTNISNISCIDDKNIKLKDILEYPIEFSELKNWTQGYYNGKKRIEILRTIEDNKAFTLTTNSTHNKHYYLNKDKNKMHHLTSIERERLQTFPDDYTLGVSKTERHKQLGNSWTVDIITHIFKGIK